MGITNITWEDVIKFEEVAGYGQHIWKHVNPSDFGILVSEMGHKLDKMRSMLSVTEPAKRKARKA